MGKKVETEEPVIHVVIRTHRRELLFRKCIESVHAQEYKNKQVHVVADDDFTAQYVKKAIAEKMVDFYYRVHGGMIRGNPKQFAHLVKAGLCKPRDNSRCNYNLYLNLVIKGIRGGWIFIVDDDKELPNKKTLKNISSRLTSDNILLVGKYAMKTRTVPEPDHWKKLPFKRGQIDMSCCIWNVKNRDIAVFDEHKASDWRVANYLAPVCDIKWMNEVFVIADNDGMFGRPSTSSGAGTSTGSPSTGSPSTGSGADTSTGSGDGISDRLRNQ